MMRIFIGFDPREEAAYHVLSRSIIARSSKPVSIAPLALTQLKDCYTRPYNPMQSTDFSFSRFLVPYLCDYQGWVLFMDCDMLALDDVAKLWDMRDDSKAVMVVKHDYKPSGKMRALNRPNSAYEKKNWSSVMLMNCARCTALTPDYVNSASGLELHRFQWLGDQAEALIGELPLRWNFLVDEYDAVPVEQISNLHYTLGGPYFEDYRNCGYASLWFKERDQIFGALRQTDTLIEDALAQFSAA